MGISSILFSSPPPVDSNETLYGGDPKFLTEIDKLCETLISQVLDYLKTLGREEVREESSQNPTGSFSCSRKLICFFSLKC